MRRFYLFIFVILIFLSGCNDLKGEGEDSLSYLLDKTYNIPVIEHYMGTPVFSGEHLYCFLGSEKPFTLVKLNLITGERTDYPLDFSENAFHIFDFNVDENGNCWFMISIRGTDEDGKWDEFALKYRDGEVLTKTRKINNELDEIHSNHDRLYVEGNTARYGNGVKSVIVNEDGTVKISDGIEMPGKKEYDSAYQGEMYHFVNGMPSEKLFDLADFDLEFDFFTTVYTLNGTIYAYKGYPTKEGTLYVFAPDATGATSKAKETNRKLLTMAVLDATSDIRAAVVSFNKDQDEYRIELKEYNDSGERGMEEAISLLVADVANGAGPDLIALVPGGSHDVLVQKGILLDLDDYLENSTIKKEDFVSAAWDIGRMDGILYGIPTEFSVQTVVTEAKLVPGIEKLDFNTMRRIHEEQKGRKLIDANDRMGVGMFCLNFQIAKYVDQRNKKTYFDSEEFRSIMNFIREFPVREQTNPDEKALFHEAFVYSFEELIDVYREMGEKELAFIGYPTDGEWAGCSVNQGNVMYGICSKTSEAEACWDFIEHSLNRHFKEQSLFLSTNRTVLKQQAEYAYDSCRNRPEWLEAEDLWNAALLLGEQKGYFNGVDSTAAFIMAEELEAFCAGRSDLEHTIDVMSNRVQNYFNEQ